MSDYTARAGYDFAEDLLDEEESEATEHVNLLAQMRGVLRQQTRENARSRSSRVSPLTTSATR